MAPAEDKEHKFTGQDYAITVPGTGVVSLKTILSLDSPTPTEELTAFTSTSAATVNIGFTPAPTTPILAGAVYTVKWVDVSKVYLQVSGSTASQTVYIFWGGI